MENKVKIAEDKAVIDGKEYKLGYNLRAQILYERLLGEDPQKQPKTLEIIIFYYSILSALNRDTFKMGFEAFIDYLDTHVHVLQQLQEWSQDYFSRKKLLAESEAEASSEDKKKE